MTREKINELAQYCVDNNIDAYLTNDCRIAIRINVDEWAIVSSTKSTIYVRDTHISNYVLGEFRKKGRYMTFDEINKYIRNNH